LQNLSVFSCKTILKLLQTKKVVFTKREWKGLRSYYKALKKLVKLYTPEIVCAKFDEYADLAGFYSDSFFDQKLQASCIKFIKKRKRAIYESYQSSVELLQILEQLISSR